MDCRVKPGNDRGEMQRAKEPAQIVRTASPGPMTPRVGATNRDGVMGPPPNAGRDSDVADKVRISLPAPSCQIVSPSPSITAY